MLNNLVYNSKENSNCKLKSKRILEMLFDDSFELHELYDEIVYYIDLNRIEVNQNTLKSLKNDIYAIENDSIEKILIDWEYVDWFPFCSYFTQELITDFRSNEFRLISQKIFEKYIDLFHALENDSDLLKVSENISKTVIEILNSKKTFQYYVSNNEVIWVYQNLHWDLSIKKYQSHWKNQIDLFTKQNKNIIQIKEIHQEIHIYQYTENLFSKILEFCYKFDYIPEELNSLKDIKSNIPNATWSTDKDDFALSDFENSLDENIIYPKYLSMNPDIIYTIEIDIINERINILKDKKTVFEINKSEMWTFLKILIKSPGRSLFTNIWLLDIFLNKIKNNKNYLT